MKYLKPMVWSSIAVLLLSTRVSYLQRMPTFRYTTLLRAELRGDA